MEKLLSQKKFNTILGIKQCTICEEYKAIDLFYKRKRSSDGHTSECKSCNDEKRRDRLKRQEAKQVVEYVFEFEDQAEKTSVYKYVAGAVVGLLIVAIIYMEVFGAKL